MGFIIIVFILSLIFISLGISLKYNISSQLNHINLKVMTFFNSELKNALTKNYSSIIKILGISDFIIGIALLIFSIIHIIYKNNPPNSIDKILYYVLIILSIIDAIVVKMKIKK